MSEPRHVAVALVYSQSTKRVLMITSRAHPKFWIFPKGGVEKGETSGQAAVRESWEEAGTPKDLRGPPDDDRIITLAVEAGKGYNRGSVWHVHVIHAEEAAVDAITDWPERQQRVREWVTLEESLRRIRTWRTDPDAAARLDGPATVHESKAKAAKKKDIKGESMELAIRAFAAQSGFSLPP